MLTIVIGLARSEDTEDHRVAACGLLEKLSEALGGTIIEMFVIKELETLSKDSQWKVTPWVQRHDSQPKTLTNHPALVSLKLGVPGEEAVCHSSPNDHIRTGSVQSGGTGDANHNESRK